MSEVVAVKRVSSETEAELACGLLRSAGIECGYRATEEIDSALDNFGEAGPHEIVVHPDDLEAARELLADTPAAGDDSWDDDGDLPPE
jgi:Putative prokaryotic signal transducing protein